MNVFSSLLCLTYKLYVLNLSVRKFAVFVPTKRRKPVEIQSS